MLWIPTHIVLRDISLYGLKENGLEQVKEEEDSVLSVRTSGSSRKGTVK